MEDTDMASPPSTLRVASQTLSNSTSQPQVSESQPSQAGPSKSKSRRKVNDGYIYQPYKDYSKKADNSLGEDGEPLTAKDGNQASATQILELHGLEKRIVQLLETAGQAIQILSGDGDDENGEGESEETGKKLLSAATLSPESRQAMVREYADERSRKFENLADGYTRLVNEIQTGLRRQFRYLTKAGISSSQVPFKNVVYGEEKELETWLNAVDVLKASADGLITKVERELLEPREAAAAAAEAATAATAATAAEISTS
ncbi:hypothetical protein BGZ80_000535 [Entomortierella chlamydospora]|uniref:Mediator of RNA polymerase II transcription subunit 11 n=1 Tax=Entomortierella chlamydospora TaxID=101097 RepID=A0A9P6MT88_9FUNG|nr:hypothetical protein BGZ79_003385 [Entomortierella chlamydospora]KAG0011649.1 hypothetical protein BGZ80_000535 [Entomortierella chlamydospora]